MVPGHLAQLSRNVFDHPLFKIYDWMTSSKMTGTISQHFEF